MKKLSRFQKIVTFIILIPLLLSMVAGFIWNGGINPLASGALIFMAYMFATAGFVYLWCHIQEYIDEGLKTSAQASKPEAE